MGPVQFGAVQQVLWKWKNPPQPPEWDDRKYDDYQPADPTQGRHYAYSQKAQAARKDYEKDLEQGVIRFSTAVEDYLQQLSQTHADDPNYQALALQSGGLEHQEHRLIIDGPDVARFALDVLKERVRVMAAYTQHLLTDKTRMAPSPTDLEQAPMPRTLDRHNFPLRKYDLERREDAAERIVLRRYWNEAEAAGNILTLEA